MIAKIRTGCGINSAVVLGQSRRKEDSGRVWGDFTPPPPATAAASWNRNTMQATVLSTATHNTSTKYYKRYPLCISGRQASILQYFGFFGSTNSFCRDPSTLSTRHCCTHSLDQSNESTCLPRHMIWWPRWSSQEMIILLISLIKCLSYL